MKTKDLSQILNIINNEIYKIDIILKKQISSISDHKLIKGLIVELYARNEYGLEPDELLDFTNTVFKKKFTNNDIDELFDCHEYYINKLREDPYINLIERFHEDNYENFSENEFINWVKSLSDSDIKHIEDMCIEKEEYEYIDLVLKIRKY